MKKWDGKDRIGTILTEYLGVKQNVVTTAIFRSFLALMAYGYPGFLPIKGAPRTGKTLFVERLNQGAGKRVVEECTAGKTATVPVFMCSGKAVIVSSDNPQADAIAVGELTPTKDITDDACVTDFEQLWAQITEEIGG